MTDDERHALRMLIREEVNTAVYASEQRLGERLDRMDERFDRMDERLAQMDGRLGRVEAHLVQVDERLAQMDGRLGRVEAHLAQVDERLDQMDGRLNRLEGMVMPMAEHLRLFGVAQREMQNDLTGVKRDLNEVKSVLNQATININDHQFSQFAMETKVEAIAASLRHDIQALEVKVDANTTQLHALEAKVDENALTFKRDMQKLTLAVQEFGGQLIKHINTPRDRAHPAA